MASNPDLTQPDTATTRAPMGHPLRGTLPGPLTYLVLAIWSGVVMTAIAAGVFAGGGASRLLLPASQAIPIAAVAIGYRAWPRFRNYLLTLDLRLVLAAQLWRVIGIAFLFALAFDQLPAGFAVPAGIGDLATGIAALAVVLSLGNGTLPVVGSTPSPPSGWATSSSPMQPGCPSNRRPSPPGRWRSSPHS